MDNVSFARVHQRSLGFVCMIPLHLSPRTTLSPIISLIISSHTHHPLSPTQGSAKIIDFGFAKRDRARFPYLHAYVQCRDYRAPELFLWLQVRVCVCVCLCVCACVCVRACVCA